MILLGINLDESAGIILITEGVLLAIEHLSPVVLMVVAVEQAPEVVSLVARKHGRCRRETLLVLAAPLVSSRRLVLTGKAFFMLLLSCHRW